MNKIGLVTVVCCQFQLRSRSERDPYSVVVEAVASGPETVTNAEAERILGIDKHVFQKSRSRRKVVTSVRGVVMGGPRGASQA